MPQDEASQESRMLINKVNPNPPSSKRPHVPRVGVVASICFNIILSTLIVVIAMRLTWLDERDQVKVHSVTGIEYDLESQYHHHTPYWDANDTVSDALWENLSTNPIVVAIPDEWAREHNLPPTARWPWDSNRGRYFIRAFHEIHCLKYVRRYVVDRQRGIEDDLNTQHVMHCLDSLRQGVMCRADDTLQPTSDDNEYMIGDGQLLQCRDWSKLTDWALSPERHACHNSLSDYKTFTHPIERFAFCPDRSPYKPVAEQYFAEHGHQDPWN